MALRGAGLREVVALLKENLDQEVAMARFIEGAAPAALQNVMAMVEQEQVKEEAKAARAASKSSGKSASKSAAKSA